MVFGSDGALYLFDYGSGWGVNKDSKLLKISYQWGNLTPLAKISGKAGAGREPLDVELSAEGSKDPEGEPLAYEWRLQPGDKIVAKTAVAKFTVTEPGEYRAEVRVSDPQGGIGTATVPVMVGNTVPVVAFESPANGDFFFPGQPVKFKVAIKDFEDGPSSAKADDFGIRTLVSALWKTADGKESETDPGIALMKQNACFNCHAVEQPLVGPPLLKIAEKYRGVAGAENESVKRVINGSTGVWGQVGMLPHPHITEDEVHFMVRWIYSLQPGKASPGMTRGLTGEIPAPGGDQANVGVLEASYTDAGRPPPLNSLAKVTAEARKRWEQDKQTFAPWHYEERNLMRAPDGALVVPSPEAKEVMLHLPVGYTAVAGAPPRSRHRMLANGWHAGVAQALRQCLDAGSVDAVVVADKYPHGA